MIWEPTNEELEKIIEDKVTLQDLVRENFKGQKFTRTVHDWDIIKDINKECHRLADNKIKEKNLKYMKTWGL